jgi:hypothetical protein
LADKTKQKLVDGIVWAKALKRQAEQMAGVFLPVDILICLTPLQFIDIPKIWTMTRYSGRMVFTLQKWNKAFANAYISESERLLD